MIDTKLARWRDAKGHRRQRMFNSPGDARSYERAMRKRIEEEASFQAARRGAGGTGAGLEANYQSQNEKTSDQRETKSRVRSQSDPRNTGGVLSEDETEATIRYCAEQYAAALGQAMSEPGTSAEAAEATARAAYKLALPTLTPSSARSYVACIVQGVHMGVYVAKEITALLYAAQLCMGPRR
jgi:hypothetical protein